MFLGYHRLGQKTMNDLIRTDTVFNKRVNIVGDISADLVLESLGKIYIKSRNKSQTLEEVITSLVTTDYNTIKAQIVEGTEGLDTSEFKDGQFIFDKLSNILYLYLDNELLELINIAPEGTQYVKRTGDTMSGRLAIYVKSGPPLYVNSSNLVKNLNAEYLDGERAETFTRRHKDENITGKWTFKAPTIFKSSALFEKDIITNGSVGSPNFSSGFGGYGWRMDADTNTLTIDNLVVRKLMKVYELVVNKISATNGSLWVSNAGKVTEVRKLEIKQHSFFSDTEEFRKFCGGLKKGDLFIKYPESIEQENLTREAFDTASGEGVVIKNCLSVNTLRNIQLVIVDQDAQTNFSNCSYSLYDQNFDFNCVFPIINRINKALYDETPNSNPRDYVSLVRSYYKYFEGGDYYYVKFDDQSIPVFKPGDILRCQKWTYGGIKYYDAIVCNMFKGYVIQVAPSFLDNKTTIKYDNSLEPTHIIQKDSRNIGMYKSTHSYKEPSEKNIHYDGEGNTTTFTYDEELDAQLLGQVEVNDSLVQIGNLWDIQRQNAVYITSTDDASPYIDVLSGINRPDYSVLYYIPIYQTVKLHQTQYDLRTFVGFTTLVNIPYTGDYYIQETSIPNFTCEYVYFKYNNLYYLAKGKQVPNQSGVEILYYLNTQPDNNTSLGKLADNFYITLESGGKIVLENEQGSIIQEQQFDEIRIRSTTTVKARLGNLDGIQNDIFPIDKQPYGYGLYGQNVFLTGEFYLNNGQAVADIGKEAISFAVSSAEAIRGEINILNTSLLKANELLKNNYYSKGTLKSAGMYIGKDSDGNSGIVLWGNKILFATTQAEFDGEEMPTALLADGKIQAKFIELQQLHSINNFYNNAALPSLHIPNYSTLRVEVSEGTYASLTGENQVYFYKPITYVSGPDIEHSIYEPHSTIIYIRRYSRSTSSCWVQCDINGDPVLNADGNPNYVTYKQFSNTAGSMYAPLNPSTMSDINNYDPEGDTTEYNHYQEFLDYIAGNAVRLWSLHQDGRGNLGGNSFYWDTDGNVTIKGTIYATNGIIGGFYLNNKSLYIPRLSYPPNDPITRSSYNPMLITDGIRDGNYQYTSQPSIQLTKEEYNHQTTSYDLKSQVTVRPDVIQITDNTNDNGKINRVILSSDGITWKKDGYELGVAGVLLNWVLIPIIDPEGRWAFYSRMSASGFNNWSNSNEFKKAFEVVYILWNSDGSMHMSFPNMTPAISDWFAENLNQGKLTFLATGTNPGRDSRLVFKDKIEGTESSYKWETSLQCYANADTYAVNQSWGDVNKRDKIKVSIDAIVFASSNKPSSKAHKFGATNQGNHNFRPDYEYFFKMTSYGYQDGTNGRASQVSLDRNALEIKSQNYLVITTADDASSNPGGVFLTIMYNNFSSVDYVPPSYGVIEDRPAGEESFSEQAAANKATYNGYAADLENRIKVVEIYYTANGISSSLLTTAKNTLETFKNAIDNVNGQTGWVNIASNNTVANAYSSASTAVTNLEEEYEQYQAKATHESQYLTVNNELNIQKNRIIENNLSNISSDEAQAAVTKYRTDIDEASTWKNNITLDNDYTDATTKVNDLKTAVDTAISTTQS